jgi:NAD+ diphosphatase
MPLQPNPNIFANNPLNRAGILRRDPHWLAAQQDNPASLLAVFHNERPLVIRKGNKVEVMWLRPSMVTALTKSQNPAHIVFLGLDRKERAYFALDLGKGTDPTQGGTLEGLGEFIDLRQIALDLAPDEAAILAQAKALLHWHAAARYCAISGETTQMVEGGYKRVTPAQGLEHFPRTDPVVIMLAVYGDEALLARQRRFPPGFYSAPAGFIEPGESIEEAAARELKEETGIEVSEVNYYCSQPWPFPSTLMIGCFARAQTRDITLDREELEDAHWFTRADLESALSNKGPIRVPPRHAIGHHLIRHWVAGQF